MSTFDFDNNKVVGYADIQSNGNASIEVIGYMDRQLIFHKLSSEEAKELFPPKGRVFAHNFVLKYNHLRNALTSIWVIQNTKEGDNYDAYIWDKSGGADEYGIRLTILKATINEDGENNFCIFRENGLIKTDEDKYILVDNRVLAIKANSEERLIPYWNASRLSIINAPYGKKYITDSRLPPNDGYIDITNNEQLVDWLVSKAFRKNWNKISTACSFKDIGPILINAFDDNDIKNLPHNIYTSRWERLKRIEANFTLTLEEFNHISEIPWVYTLVKNTIETYKQELVNATSADFKRQLEQIKKEHNLQIEIEKESYEKERNALEENHQNKIKTLKEEEKETAIKIENQKVELVLLEESITSQKEEISKIESLIEKANERKDNILADFTIIKDVLGNQSPNGGVFVPTTQNLISIEGIEASNTECMFFAAYGKSLEETFKANRMPYDKVSTITEILAFYKTILVPDATFAMALIYASQKCFYGIEYVNVGWKSFSNLWEEGLGQMVDHCHKNPETMHFLVLQNINLSYLPNFLQPLVDIQMGILSKFPKTEIAFPDNLRVLCTCTDEEVIPMSAQCLKHIGCIEKSSQEPQYELVKPCYNERFGFLSPSKLQEAATRLTGVSNFYNSYLNG